MVNAIKIAAEIVAALPKKEWSPETTRSEKVLFIRCHKRYRRKSNDRFYRERFVTGNLTTHEERLRSIAEAVLKQYAKATMQFEVTEQYRNMKEVLDKNPHVAENAKRLTGARLNYSQ